MAIVVAIVVAAVAEVVVEVVAEVVVEVVVEVLVTPVIEVVTVVLFGTSVVGILIDSTVAVSSATVVVALVSELDFVSVVVFSPCTMRSLLNWKFKNL